MRLFKRKRYYWIKWAYDSNTSVHYDNVIKARSGPDAWIKLCKKHIFPISVIKITEIK